MTQEQANHVPYSPDVLGAHEPGLVFAREFGVNTTTDIGDPFVATGGVEPDAAASINARLGQLQVSTLESAVEFVEPRGRTFVIPDWSTYPDSPLVAPGTKYLVIYARSRFLQQDRNLDNPLFPDVVSVVLGELGLVGHVPAGNFATYEIFRTMGGTTPVVQINNWTAGVPALQGTVPFTAPSPYWRIILQSDGLTFTDFFAAWSPDGISWLQVAQLSLNIVIRRVGLACQGFAEGGLDWIRAYTYVVDAITANWFTPLPPETGGRLFVP